MNGGSHSASLVTGAPLAVDLGDAKIGVEPPQRAAGQLFLVVHAAREKSTASIGLSVVQAEARIAVDAVERVELAGVEIEERESVGDREHRAAARAQRHGADIDVEAPVAHTPVPRLQSPDRRIADAAPGAVEPVEAALLDVPYRAFAQVVGAVEHAFDFHGHWVIL